MFGRKTIVTGVLAGSLSMAAAVASAAPMADLSSHFDTASDFSTPSVVWNSTGTTLTSAITDPAAGVVEFRTSHPSTSPTVTNAYFSTVTGATFNPSTQGPITSIDWAAEVSRTDGLSAGQNLPLLVQGGVMYVLKGGNVDPARAIVGNAFYNFDTPTGGFDAQMFSPSAVATDFEALNTTTFGWSGGAGGGAHTLGGVHPDFTSTGGEITFGYMLANVGSSSARTNATLTRNTSVVVNYIPEPASIALLGLGGLMMLRRRSK